jgi:hypothetical protein
MALHGRDNTWAPDHGSAVRGLYGGVPRAGINVTLDGRDTRWTARHLGDLRALLLFIFLGAPFIEALRGNQALHGALSAITAAVVGVVLNLAIWFAMHTIFRETRPVRSFGFSFDAPVLASIDVWALLLAVAAVVAMFRFKVGMIQTLAACSAAGVALYLSGMLS